MTNLDDYFIPRMFGGGHTQAPWLIFENEGLDRAGAAALLSLTKALQEERATGAVAVAIANHVARYQHNRHARLRLPADE